MTQKAGPDGIPFLKTPGSEKNILQDIEMVWKVNFLSGKSCHGQEVPWKICFSFKPYLSLFVQVIFYIEIQKLFIKWIILSSGTKIADIESCTKKYKILRNCIILETENDQEIPVDKHEGIILKL